ncbi:MAG: hypothetical protein IKM33_06235, partial [Clostridia bacterium]|nr:hypothetical protein [Clostridia bacterium]
MENLGLLGCAQNAICKMQNAKSGNGRRDQWRLMTANTLCGQEIFKVTNCRNLPLDWLLRS